MPNNFTYSKNGLALTQFFEGARLTAYQDQVGVWTIGYGHTGPDVHEGLTITQDEANDLLMRDVQLAAHAVSRLVAVAISQQQFDALVDFAFNVGIANFANSTLLKDLNSSRFTDAADEFGRWNHAGGVEVAGLTKRRTAEADLFRQGMEIPGDQDVVG